MSFYDYQGNVIETGTETYPYTALSAFHRFGVCGASWDSGYYYITPTTHIEREDVSWGANIARRNGNVFCNYSKAAMTTRSYLTNSNCMPKLLNDTACDLYIITLGGNDCLHLGMDYLGSITDITNYESYADYPDTYYGNYGKIIEKIQEHAPSAKIVTIMTYGSRSNATRLAFGAAMEEIAEHYGLPHMCWADDPWQYSTFVQDTSLVHDHPTPMILAGTALAFERLFSKCVKDYYEYFRFYNGSSF